MSLRTSFNTRWTSLGKREKVEILLSFLFRVSMLVGLLAMAFRGQWAMVFVIFLGLLATFLPSVLQKNAFRTLPAEFELLFIIFIYASIYLGEHEGFYAKFWWWDVMLHSGSGFGLGLVGFLILYSFYTKGMLRLQPLLIVLFSFAFSLALGSLWEIFEFTIDQIFKTNMQRGSLTDTMKDLIMDTLGALFISGIGYFHLKHGHNKAKKGIVDSLIHRLMTF